MCFDACYHGRQALTWTREGRVAVEDEYLGQWSTPVHNVIEQGAVRKFAQAIGDHNPNYWDEDAAKECRYGRLLAPPTFAVSLDFGELPSGQFDFTGMIHGEQTFSYNRPLFVGETVACSVRLADRTVRKSGAASMTFYVLEQQAVASDGTVVFTARMTVIKREGVTP